jgi:hypothetical protein
LGPPESSPLAEPPDIVSTRTRTQSSDGAHGIGLSAHNCLRIIEKEAFEAAIEYYLVGAAGDVETDSANFDRERGLDPTVLIWFILETPPDTWRALDESPGTNTAARSVLACFAIH